MKETAKNPNLVTETFHGHPGGQITEMVNFGSLALKPF